MIGAGNREVLLAFDFGLRRLGVATANLHTRTATPLTTLEVGSDVPWPELDRVIAEWQPTRLIVGLPQGDGAAALAARILGFVAALERRYGLPVSTVDETLTSEAARAEISAGRRRGYLRRRTAKGRTDTLAACLIAEQWMSER